MGSDSAKPQTALPIRLVPKLEGLGSRLVLAGTVATGQIDAGGRAFLPAGGIEYRLELVNTGGAVLLSGKATGRLQAVCDRCLAKTEFDLSAEVQEYLVFSGSLSSFANANAEFVVVEPTDETDLLPFIEAALVFELPMTVLCTPDCAGLCPRCGADLNAGACACDKGPVDDHPFAALKALLEVDA
jgi:uncharacterized protein